MDVERCRQALSKLLVYSPLLNRPLLQEFSAFLDSPAENYPRFFTALAETALEVPQVAGSLWQNALLYEILSAENLFTSLAEKGELTESLMNVVKRDLANLELLFHFDPQRLSSGLPDLEGLVEPQKAETPFHKLMFTFAQESSWPHLAHRLAAFYRRYGTGIVCQHWAFKWTGELTGITKPHSIALDDLMGLVKQKELLLANTKQFLQDLPANCALLHGARGTGKSSLVKAVGCCLAPEGLHMVEVAKEDLAALPELMALLGEKTAKFVVFIDDLSFEEQETNYKALKAALEGSLAERPDNVLIYATSNRRHLIVESFRERDEIHGRDTVEEKLSLADRFGLQLTFPSLDQEEYLAIVKALANSLPISEEELKERAIRWERRASGRSGRVARHFVLSLAGELGVRPDWLNKRKES